MAKSNGQWLELEARARTSIYNGTDLQRLRVWRVFQIISYPSFQNATSVELLQIGKPGDDEAYDVAVMEWDRGTDEAALASEKSAEAAVLSPTIRVTRGRISTVAAKSLISTLGKVSIPLLPKEHPHGFDGTTYWIRIGNPSFGSASCSWWSDGPEEWRALTAAALDVQASIIAIAADLPTQ